MAGEQNIVRTRILDENTQKISILLGAFLIGWGAAHILFSTSGIIVSAGGAYGLSTALLGAFFAIVGGWVL